MSLKDFQILGKLGQGAYSVVYHVKRLIDDTEYAMKKVKMNNLSDKERDNALNQVRILASINHPSIIAYKEAFIEKGTNFLYIIMEYADGGDLLTKIKNHQQMNTKFDEQQIWTIFLQSLQGLKVLHDLKILHRDIKSANIFLTKSGEAKLGDLNVSKMVKSMCQTQTGTPYYASPQIWKDQPYDKKSDIWSLGCVLYQTIALKPPFRSSDMQGLYKKVVRGFYPRIPPQYSNDLTIVLKMMLQVAPHLRTTSGTQKIITDKLLEFPLIQKHFMYEPQKNSPQLKKSNQLMKTIKMNKIQGKVELPKPRYFSTLDIPSISQNQEEELKKLVLPKISRTMDDTHQKQSVSIEWNKKNQLVRKITQPLKKQKSSRNYVQKHVQISNPSKKMAKMYEGRLRQLSPKIIQKILKNEREKHKIKSIINNNN